MTAVDTNIIVRLLTGDDPGQAAIARDLFATDNVWVAKTVLLETSWVLRRSYAFTDEAIRHALTKLVGLRNVRVEDPLAVGAAMALNAHGVQFADAMHLVSRPLGARFVSFDRPLVRRAKRAGQADVSEPSGST